MLYPLSQPGTPRSHFISLFHDFCWNGTFKVTFGNSGIQISQLPQGLLFLMLVWWLSRTDSVKSVFFVMHGHLIVCWGLSFQCSQWVVYNSTLAFTFCLLKAPKSTRGDRLRPSKVFPRHVITLYVVMAFWVTKNVCFSFSRFLKSFGQPLVSPTWYHSFR